MIIEAVKVKAKATQAEKTTELGLIKSWLAFKEKLISYAEQADKVAVELQFESSFDVKTHHTFNADEQVFISDVSICPKGGVLFVVPFGGRDKTFRFAEAELINVTHADGSTESFKDLVNQTLKETFTEFPDINSITMFERKHLVSSELVEKLADAENYLAAQELSETRVALYSKLDLFGVFNVKCSKCVRVRWFLS